MTDITHTDTLQSSDSSRTTISMCNIYADLLVTSDINESISYTTNNRAIINGFGANGSSFSIDTKINRTPILWEE